MPTHYFSPVGWPAVGTFFMARRGIRELSVRVAVECFQLFLNSVAASEGHNDARFIVKDKNGYALAHVHYDEEPGRRSAANLMTKDEAR
jgi:hypothetical protein